MAVRAYVLVETSAGENVSEVVAAIAGVSGVRSADSVVGPYDVVAIVEADDLAALGKIVTEEIRALPGVAKTISLVVLPPA